MDARPACDGWLRRRLTFVTLAATLTPAGVTAPPPAVCSYCNGGGLFYSDPDLGPCACRTPTATIDFETKSEAGFIWNEERQKWDGPPGAAQNKKGLGVIGAAVYAEHPSTDVLTLSYKLPGDIAPTRWQPGKPLALLQRLFDWIAASGRVEAHNVMFERLIWTLICVPRYGFPPLPPEQLDCSMATARVNQRPGKLENLGNVLGLAVRKNKDGRRLLNKFSVPRAPTKSDPRRWITVDEDPDDAERLYAYCDDDVTTEEAARDAMPPMTAAEREFWLVDQEINWRGLGVDRPAIRDCLAVLRQALDRYGQEMRELTGGIEPTQLAQLKGWLAGHGVFVDSLDADHVENLLARLAPGPARRAIEIRALVGSASVKKLFAMENMASADDRLRNLIVHHGARTGRPTGEGAQPLNMPRSGPKLITCADHACSRPFKPALPACPWCQAVRPPPGSKAGHPRWQAFMVDHVLEIMSYRSLELVEWFFGDALLSISGCARGMFVAAPGNDLVASDYSAIEAVVTAELAGEQWRRDTFHAKKDIYLSSASKITGTTVEEYLAYKAANDDDHPDRQKIGKVAELALGFGGWINAWRNFDDSDTFNDYQVKELIKAWRAASPNIVELWGGQWRGRPVFGVPPHNAVYAESGKAFIGYAERYGFEGAWFDALDNPDTDIRPRVRAFDDRGTMLDWRDGPDVTFRYNSKTDALMITLPSGRQLTYHEPRAEPSVREYAAPGELSASYMTWNSNAQMGPIGWVRMSTFGGRLMENIVQATAHCLLRFAILNLRAAGFPTVLHVYDEIVVEIMAVAPHLREAVIAQVEEIMSRVPPWAAGWPVRASGGWIGRRYRKG